MKTPNSKQFKKVIAAFDHILKTISAAREEQYFDMGEPEVKNPKNFCGSPMCHGGWYVVARTQTGLPKDLKTDALKAACGHMDYEAGAHIMANDLGFETEDHLTAWAYSNMTIWGNFHGGRMFCSNLAFGEADTMTLVDVRNHWADVHNRARPRATPIPHVKVTTQLVEA